MRRRGWTWSQSCLDMTTRCKLRTRGTGTGRLFVVEKPGRVWIVRFGVELPEPFLDIRDVVGDAGQEQGLLSMAFHPDFGANGVFT